MTHMDFSILYTNVGYSYILKIYQKHQFLVIKQKHLKVAVFFVAIYPCIQDVPLLKQENNNKMK